MQDYYKMMLQEYRNTNYTALKEKNQEELKKNWEDIEQLVLTYQTQFKPGVTREEVKIARDAADQLIRRFMPLAKKYVTLLRTNIIDWNDNEMKAFISSFINEPDLRYALRRPKQKAPFRRRVYENFNFIKESYGKQTEEEILVDLQMLILVMAKRYQQVGKNFCAYINNGFKFEVARHIKKFLRNPLNIHYKNIEYEDCMEQFDFDSELQFETNYYEDAMGLPDLTWISGLSASEAFQELTPIERKLLVKYYLEDWNDRQISEEFGTHINTINQQRRSAVEKIAMHYAIDMTDVKRSRNSGNGATIPYQPN